MRRIGRFMGTLARVTGVMVMAVFFVAGDASAKKPWDCTKSRWRKTHQQVPTCSSGAGSTEPCCESASCIGKTCEGGDIYSCPGEVYDPVTEKVTKKANPVKTPCNGGCVVKPFGVPDTCTK